MLSEKEHYWHTDMDSAVEHAPVLREFVELFVGHVVVHDAVEDAGAAVVALADDSCVE